MFTIPTLLMHFVVIIFLVCVFMGMRPKKKAPDPTALLTIGSAYNSLSKRIHAANTYAEITALRGLLSEFYKRKYHDNPNSCMRKALRDSLMISYQRKEAELNKITEKYIKK